MSYHRGVDSTKINVLSDVREVSCYIFKCLRADDIATWVPRCRKSMRRNPLTPDTTPQMFWFTGNNAIQMEISEVQS